MSARQSAEIDAIAAEQQRDELAVLLEQTPPTDAEMEAVRRYWAGESTADDLGDALGSRLQRALDKRTKGGDDA